MHKLNIKPISVNQCWQGRRYKTTLYSRWEKVLLYTLPNILDVSEREIYIYLEWGLSTKSADIDNPTKPFLDVMQKKYGFNDKNIQSLFLKKTYTAKGNEYIAFSIFNSQKELINFLNKNT